MQVKRIKLMSKVMPHALPVRLRPFRKSLTTKPEWIRNWSRLVARFGYVRNPQPGFQHPGVYGNAHVCVAHNSRHNYRAAFTWGARLLRTLTQDEHDFPEYDIFE